MHLLFKNPKFCALGMTLSILVLGSVSFADANDFSNWRSKPRESFPKGEAAFEKVKKTLLEKYIEKGLTEEDLYRAAVQGMVSNVDPAMAEWNKLMTPAEYSELQADIDGKIVGIGVEIDFNETTGYANVLGVIPGTPSAESGIVRGDQILKIDGENFRGKQLRDIVYAIRGKSGSEVKLTILHDDKVLIKRLKREGLVWETVNSKMVNRDTALLTIHSFVGSTPSLLEKNLRSLKSKGVKKLIVDLRGNEGGVFERTIESVNLLIPKDQLIVSVTTRDKPVEKIKSSAGPIIDDVSIAVLMNGATKSGAEIMAAALKTSAGATTIGTKTFGKWSAQKVDELPNKYAIKYTTSTFVPASGVDLAGKGLPADITVELPEELIRKLQSQPSIEERLKEDVQLQAAINVLNLKARG
ncbi:MAG: S41 family peptidase [Oligoflexales bacterium]